MFSQKKILALQIIILLLAIVILNHLLIYLTCKTDQYLLVTVEIGKYILYNYNYNYNCFSSVI